MRLPVRQDGYVYLTTQLAVLVPFDLGTVGGGTNGSADFALTLNTPVPGIFSQLTNTVVMDASNATAANAQDTTPIDAEVDLRIVKTDGGVTAALGKVHQLHPH